MLELIISGLLTYFLFKVLYEKVKDCNDPYDQYGDIDWSLLDNNEK